MGIALVVDPYVLAFVHVDIDITPAFVHVYAVSRIIAHFGPVNVSVNVSVSASVGCL